MLSAGFADTLFLGPVLTMDGAAPRGGGVAIRGGKVMAVGDDRDLHALAGPATRVVQLKGSTLMPGFHDAHVHLTGTGRELDQLDLKSTGSLDEALELVRRRAAQLGPDDWIQGAGFTLHRWGMAGIERAHADALEAAAGGRPVALASQDHHSLWVSRRVLERAGVRADSRVEGGVVALDEDGQPSGLLLELASDLVESVMPLPDAATIDRWLKQAGDYFAALGVTTVHHMAAEPAAHFRRLALGATSEQYPLRVWACIPHAQIEEAAAIGLATGQGGDNFRIGGAKFFADGALGSRTAWMLEPYAGTTERGMPLDGPEVLAERVPLAIRAGLTPVIHAIGDAATSAVLDAFGASQALWRQAGLRPRLEHAQHMRPQDVARAGAMGLVASMQPIHLTFDLDSIEATLPDRLARAYPMRSLARAGAVLAFGSDSPVASPDVFLGLRAAARRLSSGGRRLTPAEAISPDAALLAYTVGAAYAVQSEARSGKLAPGYDADLVILSHDPTVSLDGLEVVATMKGGRFTFGEERL